MIAAISVHKIIIANLVDVVFNREVLNGGSVESNICVALKYSIYYILIYTPQSEPCSDKAVCMHFTAAFAH